VTFRGTAAVYRKIGPAVKFYFVRKGMTFNDGGAIRRGFDVVTGDPASVYLREKTGRLSASAAGSIKFYHPSLTGVKLNGKPAPPIARGDGWVSVAIPPGNSTIELLAPPGE
jgi:hypothetical protein